MGYTHNKNMTDSATIFQADLDGIFNLDNSPGPILSADRNGLVQCRPVSVRLSLLICVIKVFFKSGIYFLFSSFTISNRLKETD